MLVDLVGCLIFLCPNIEGDTLLVRVNYGGGCADHAFGACFGEFQEREPVQAAVLIGHAANGDQCFGAISEQLAVDLTPLKRAYQAAYGVQRGSVGIALEAAGLNLEYAF